MELRPITSQGHQLLHRGRRYHYPKEALGIHYGDFDVVLPARLPKPHTSTTPGSTVSEPKMASSPAQAIEAFDRLSDREKTKVLAYLCAGHPHKAVQVTEGEEWQELTMLAMILLLFFTLLCYMA
jgi:hypothetical protein